MEEEKKKEGFFKRLNKDLKLQISFCFASVLTLILVYLPLSYFVENAAMKEKVLNRSVTNDENVLADITNVDVLRDKLAITGWVIRLDAEVQGVKVVLNPLNSEESEEIVLKAILGQDETVQNYLNYLQEESISGVGFKVEVSKEKLQKAVSYEILVYVDYKLESEQEVKVSSQKILYNEQVYSYNPMDFKAPKFVDEQMAKVVRDGYLLGYAMENGAWVYQYKNSLYWILDKNIGNNSDDNLYIFLHIHTTTPELLPEERKKHGVDLRDFLFVYKEIFQDDTYRVAKEDLCYDYTLTWLRTGEYDVATDMNAWKTRFLTNRE